jgi:hypothetical protein
LRSLLALCIAVFLAAFLPACGSNLDQDQIGEGYSPGIGIPEEGVSFQSLPKGVYEIKTVHFFAERRNGDARDSVTLTHDFEPGTDRSRDNLKMQRLTIHDKDVQSMQGRALIIPKIVADSTMTVSSQLKVYDYEVSRDGQARVAITTASGSPYGVQYIEDLLPRNKKNVYTSSKKVQDARGNSNHYLHTFVAKVDKEGTLTVYHYEMDITSGESPKSDLMMSASVYKKTQ